MGMDFGFPLSFLFIVCVRGNVFAYTQNTFHSTPVNFYHHKQTNKLALKHVPARQSSSSSSHSLPLFLFFVVERLLLCVLSRDSPRGSLHSSLVHFVCDFLEFFSQLFCEVVVDVVVIPVVLPTFRVRQVLLVFVPL